MDDFGVIVSALGSVVGVAAAGIGGWRWVRARLTRRWLRRQLSRILAENRMMVTAVGAANQALIDGVGQHGWSIPPPTLGPALATLDNVEIELLHVGATIRGRDADGSLERLRDDLEEACRLLAEQLVVYVDGVWTAYRDFDGAEVGTAANGSVTIGVLQGDRSPDEQRELEASIDRRRRTFTHLIRASAHRLGDELKASHFACRWPIATGELDQYLDPPRLRFRQGTLDESDEEV